MSSRIIRSMNQFNVENSYFLTWTNAKHEGMFKTFELVSASVRSRRAICEFVSFLARDIAETSAQWARRQVTNTRFLHQRYTLSWNWLLYTPYVLPHSLYPIDSQYPEAFSIIPLFFPGRSISFNELFVKLPPYKRNSCFASPRQYQSSMLIFNGVWRDSIVVFIVPTFDKRFINLINGKSTVALLTVESLLAPALPDQQHSIKITLD